MLQPGTLALVLVLVGAGAGAQPSPGPALRQRSLTVTGNPAEPVPEVRGAKTVRQVTAESEELAPGKRGWVWVETDVPPADAGVEFTLEVTGTDGRSVQVPMVPMPPRTPEGKR